ncbi:hypothetical protein [Clostridium manihotivorum]|nr:hypothetical protein [Clostridium manihotivorum]
MRKIKRIWAILCLFIIILIVISIYPPIPRPDIIIVHNGNISITISKENKEYENIVNLTSKRFTLRSVQTRIDHTEKENMIRDNTKSIEFIYDKEQSFRSKKNFLDSVLYRRLLFPIESSDKGKDGFMIFGSEKEYYDLSVKNLIQSSKLDKALRDLN